MLALWPLLGFAQWTNMGVPLVGDSIDDHLGFREAISLDSAGTTMAVGSRFYNDGNSLAGFAKVYDWNGTTWTQRGNTFPGVTVDANTGTSVSLSADGNTIAIGSGWATTSLNMKAGLVQVHDWNGSSWVQRGSNIDGEGDPNPVFEGDVFGSDVCLTPDGNFLAVGGESNTPQAGVLQFSGHARVFRWDGQDWVQMGQDLDGVMSLERFGTSISINRDASIVAVGGPDFDQELGIVRIYEWNGTDWSPRGGFLNGIGTGSKFGMSVSLNGDGDILAVGSPSANGFAGEAVVFEWNGSNYVVRSIIPGASSSQAGHSVDLNDNGNILAVGQAWYNFSEGRTVVYKWDGNTYTQLDNTLNNVNGSGVDGFGYSVALNSSGSVVMVGSPWYEPSGPFFNDHGRVQVFQNVTLTGVEDSESLSVSYFPNPTASQLNVSSEDQIEAINLYDLSGRTVMSVVGTGREMQLDLSTLRNGTYYMQIRSLGQIKVVPVVKS